MKALGKRFKNITGDIMLSSGQIAYTGVFVIGYRSEMLQGWAKLLEERKITCSEPFSLRETLGKEVEIREWVINKLPNDMLSIDNGIMMAQSNRWPLMIDPQGQANKWIKATYKDDAENQLVVLKQNNPTFVRNMEMGIHSGSPVLLENVPEFLDPILEQILTKQIVTTGGIQTVQLGDNAVEYDPKFKLFITTKLMNPHYPPELCVKVNLLNFMATAEGLEDQMLGQCVAREEPKLEAQREQLVLDDAANQKALQEIEDTILNLLKTAKGNILDDEVLIKSLNQSKSTSDLIGEKVKQSQKTKGFIAKTRDRYQSVGFHVSQLFFCIADLASVDPMYQYSLEWYINLFNIAIDNAEKDKDPVQRTKNLNDTFTYTLYVNVCRSLFAKDKLLFSFLLATKIMLGQGSLEQENLTYLLQGNIAMDLERPNPAGAGSWLTDKIWGEMLAMSKLSSFQGIDKDVEANLPKYRTIFEAVDAELTLQEMTIVDDSGRAVSTGKDRYTIFERLCILRALRPDVCVPVIQTFITEEIGETFIDPPPFDLMTCYKESNCTTPLVFVLTPGAAPMDELLKLADEVGFSDKLTSMSLGQAREKAERHPRGTALREVGVPRELPPLRELDADPRAHLRGALPRACGGALPALADEQPEQGLPGLRAAERRQDDERAAQGHQGEPRHQLREHLRGLPHGQPGQSPVRRAAGGVQEAALFALLLPRPPAGAAQVRPSGVEHEVRLLAAGLEHHHGAAHDLPRLIEPRGGGAVRGHLLPGGRVQLRRARHRREGPANAHEYPHGVLHARAGLWLQVLAERHLLRAARRRPRIVPEYIKGLPYHEGPEVFGLHDNANTTFALAETDALLTTALSLQSKSGGSGGGGGGGGDGGSEVGDGGQQSWDALIAGVADDVSARLLPFSTWRRRCSTSPRRTPRA